MRTLLNELGPKAWQISSGGRGLHGLVPLWPRLGWQTVKGFWQAVNKQLAQTFASRFVSRNSPANRVGKRFVDYSRNGFGAATAAAFNARARLGVGVSLPVAWDELDGLRVGNHWTLANARDHRSLQTQDLWQGLRNCRQSLGAAMKALGHAPLSAGHSARGEGPVQRRAYPRRPAPIIPSTVLVLR